MKPPSRQPAIRVTMRPKDTNALGSIFGGVITSLIDEAAFVEATRQAPRRYVTVAMEKIEFHKPVRVGDIVSLWAETVEIGRTSIRMRVDVLVRCRESDEDIRVTSAEVTMVATDDSNRPTPIFNA
ncbi:MAG: hotdog domain-containing protein [Gammaproteobacteria bacterium]